MSTPTSILYGQGRGRMRMTGTGQTNADTSDRLLFMTYNGWVMLAVAVGAFVGYMLFSESSATKTAACH